MVLVDHRSSHALRTSKKKISSFVPFFPVPTPNSLSRFGRGLPRGHENFSFPRPFWSRFKGKKEERGNMEIAAEGNVEKCLKSGPRNSPTDGWGIFYFCSELHSPYVLSANRGSNQRYSFCGTFGEQKNRSNILLLLLLRCRRPFLFHIVPGT